jgi:hypothetical protein
LPTLNKNSGILVFFAFYLRNLLMGNAHSLAKYPADAEKHNKLHLLTGNVIH